MCKTNTRGCSTEDSPVRGRARLDSRWQDGPRLGRLLTLGCCGCCSGGLLSDCRGGLLPRLIVPDVVYWRVRLLTRWLQGDEGKAHHKVSASAAASVEASRPNAAVAALCTSLRAALLALLGGGWLTPGGIAQLPSLLPL